MLPSCAINMERGNNVASLDLGTLKASVSIDGADKAKSDLKSVNDTIKSTEKSSDSLSKGGMSNLMKSFKEGASNASLFGIKLGDLGGALTSGAGMSSLMQGAVAGLAMSFVNLAVQAIQQAITALWDFGKQSVQVASDLQESANVVDVVFGDDNKVTKWSQEMAKAFNLSTLEAQKFAGTMGAVLTPSGLGKDVVEDMSITLTQLSGDLGSLWNTSTEQAFNALRSGITGEMEPLKQFGVVMSVANLEAFALAQGIDKSWKSMTQAEQALVRYNYILANTTTAQGDATRTADGYANASKQMELAIEDASNAFGQGFLPGLVSMKQQVADFISTNEELIAFVGNTLGTVLNAVVETGRLAYSIMKPFIELANYAFGALNKVISFFNDGLHEATTEIRGSLSTTSKEVTYSMQDMAGTTKSAMDDASKSVSESFGTMEVSAKESINGISKAYDSYFNKQMSDYEKELRERFNSGTLAEEKKIQKKLAQHEEMLNKQLQKDEEYEKRRAEIEAKYRKVTTTNGNSTSISYVPRYANGTSNAKGGLSVVGEVGRELMYIPPQAQIINNNTTEKILSGTGTTISGNNITVMANNVQELINELKMAVISGELA